VYEQDTHVYNSLEALYGMLFALQAWYFKINEMTCADFYLCDFDRSNPLALVLYGDVIIFP
jgi:hypothetical protein